MMRLHASYQWLINDLAILCNTVALVVMAYKHRRQSHGAKTVHRSITFGIKISDISKDVTEQMLKHHFRSFGIISSVFLKISSPCNYAFVNYVSLEGAKMAAAVMNGKRIGQNAVKVKLQGDDCSVTQPFIQSKDYTLKISNINPTTTQKRLSMLFKTDVNLKVVPGKPYYAYANYDSEADMKDALKLHDFLLDDFNIQVKLSRSSIDHSTTSPLPENCESYQVSCPHQFSVKITNINPITTLERLSELFKTVVFVNVVPGGPNYAYANYASLTGMEYALKLHNEVIDDFKIQVKIAKTKTRLLKNPLQKKVHRWQYENDKGQLDFYTEEQSQSIEAMWQSRTPSTIHIGKWTYTFDFGTMEQINVSTKRRRRICRDSQLVLDSNQDASQDQSDLSSPGPNKQGVYVLPRQRSTESNMISEEVPLTATLPHAKINEISAKHDVGIHELTSNKVVFIGLESKVLKATVEIKDIMLKDTKGESYPEEWVSQDDELELKLLVNGSTEWSKVSELFHATLPSKAIVKIERIQNKWLWEKYHQHSERMKRKNEGLINEMLLFHGTRNTPPSDIYQHEEGFDMRFGRAGMWGNGNYFAVKASYSDKYAYCLSDGTQQVFLAKVLTGRSIDLDPNSSLRMPPIIKSGVKGNMRYDTVTGHTHGSQVYIAYSNDKAYPFYLISYK